MRSKTTEKPPNPYLEDTDDDEMVVPNTKPAARRHFTIGWDRQKHTGFAW
jgi:hypothetical protein